MRKLLLAGLLVAGSVFGDPISLPIITVTPVLGPDNLASSNFDDWAANAIEVLKGNTNTGSGVTAYEPVTSPMNGSEFIVPPFAAWQGVAGLAPGGATEYGNVLYFSFKIDGNGSTFFLDDLSAQETYLGDVQLPYVAGDFDEFSVRLVGRRSSDSSYVTSGLSSGVELNALYYVGLGFATGLDSNATGTDQQQLDYTAEAVRSLSDKTTRVCYSVGGGEGCGSVTIADSNAGIPEPGTMVLLGAGLAGVALLRRRSA